MSPRTGERTDGEGAEESMLRPDPPPTQIRKEEAELIAFEPQEPCDLDEVLLAAGEFGLYQKLLFAAMIPFAVFFAHVLFVQMFVTATPQQYWCAVPELGHLALERRRELAIPLEADGEWSRCRQYAVNWSALVATGLPAKPDPVWSSEPCRHGYEFLRDDIPYPTISTELEWVCDKQHYATVAQTVFFVGSLAGGVLFGWLADKSGRVPALVGSNLCGCVGGVATVWATDLLQFCLCRFLVGFAYDNCFMMMYIIVLEYVGPRYRSRAANLSIALFFGAGCVTLPWLALLTADWRRLLLVTSLPMLVVCVAPLLVPESARWLMVQGRVKEATRIVRRLAAVNKKTIPPHLLDRLQSCAGRTEAQAEGGVRQLVTRPGLRGALLALVVVFMACALVFDALVRLSDAFGLNFFVTFTLTSATEIPSVTLLSLLLDRWGRRSLTCWPMVLCGGLCIAAVLVPPGVPRASMGIAARFCINMSYNAVIQWGAELLPTGARAGGSNFVHMCGYLATALSPLIVYLGVYVSWCPLVLMCAACACGAAACCLLPETLGRPLPNTFAEGEAMVASVRCWPCKTNRQDTDSVEMNEA